ncbi:hypothetical protein DFH94DRAFT_685524 [Russula ochroleuca]|uniref:Uncharacterized protein n=1 Tax=Russula ochroleuca TaxID=152965 RepID=A0A9P5JWW2_9AGAM|nr:hypothetical protein DFH94DRAFT_685524 [Russula ochroleuca]
MFVRRCDSKSSVGHLAVRSDWPSCKQLTNDGDVLIAAPPPEWSHRQGTIDTGVGKLPPSQLPRWCQARNRACISQRSSRSRTWRAALSGATSRMCFSTSLGRGESKGKKGIGAVVTGPESPGVHSDDENGSGDAPRETVIQQAARENARCERGRRDFTGGATRTGGNKLLNADGCSCGSLKSNDEGEHREEDKGMSGVRRMAR